MHLLFNLTYFFVAVITNQQNSFYMSKAHTSLSGPPPSDFFVLLILLFHVGTVL